MKCPVCDKNTFDDKDWFYDICTECFWEYDPIQVAKPDYSGGANCHSLNEYREKYWTMKKMNSSFSCENETDMQHMVDWDRSASGRAK